MCADDNGERGFDVISIDSLRTNILCPILPGDVTFPQQFHCIFISVEAEIESHLG